MFVGRDKELEELEKRYTNDKFEFIVMYGRRRVGKTRLLEEFCKNKNHIFFSAKEESKKLSLDTFSKTYNEYMQNNELRPFKDFEALFEQIYIKFKDERLIVVIDEFPYVANADKSLMSTLQHLIDHKFKDSKIFFIFCGSSISFMEYKVLAYKSPLYGRRTGQMKILPISFKDSLAYMQNFSNEDKINAYSIMGGIPHYLNTLNDKASISENITENFFNLSSFLSQEPENLIKQELREPAIYNSVIEAIATRQYKT